MRALLPQWAAQVESISTAGQPIFRTTNAVFHSFKQWVTDDANDVHCVEVITRARVKQTLAGLYTDQLHRGDSNGLQHKRGSGNCHLWNFTEVGPSRPIGSDGSRFEREMLKRAFAMLDTTGDVAATASALALTPAQRGGLQPASVTQIAYALATTGEHALRCACTAASCVRYRSSMHNGTLIVRVCMCACLVF